MNTQCMSSIHLPSDQIVDKPKSGKKTIVKNLKKGISSKKQYKKKKKL